MRKKSRFSWSRVVYVIMLLTLITPTSVWAQPLQQTSQAAAPEPVEQASQASAAERLADASAALIAEVGQPPAGAAAAVAQDGGGLEVETAVTEQFRQKGAAGFMVYFRDQPSLAGAEQMDWVQRGRFVLEQLQSVANRSQKNVRAFLDKRGVSYRSFWIDNVIIVEETNVTVFEELKRFPEISVIRDRRTEMLVEPTSINPLNGLQEQLFAIEPNISHVQAPETWALGFNGQGSVVSSIDSGVRFTHQALVGAYRGNLGGGVFDHNYNWWDPYGDHPAAPADDNGHGTHTMGTMVGSDGDANQIGMAPGADWMACRGCSTSNCTDTALLSCAQFIVAPWDLNQANPDPDQRPMVVNNSWGDCGQSYDPWFRDVVDSWRAAGIYPVFSNGNNTNCGYSSPPACGTVGNPARYGNVTGVGATGQSNGAYATFSNRGPTDNVDAENGGGFDTIKPQVAAPGSNIRSSVPYSDTAYEGGWSGTSMAAPHVSGLTALIFQAAPCLKGNFTAVEDILQQTAVQVTGLPAAGCSGEGPNSMPNQSSGWGEIRALAAVQLALTSCGPMGTLAGTVTDAVSGAPLAGVKIQAVGSDRSFQATTDAAGFYSSSLPVGDYTVNFSAYGYMPESFPGVGVTENAITTQDAALDPAPSYTVAGKVWDPAAGWGVYAKISIDGYPGAPVWTDPATGAYSITLVAGQNYTFKPEPVVSGYLPLAVDTGVLSGGLALDLPMQADANNCSAPGYVLDVNGVYETFESASFPPAGWTVTNNGGNCDWVGDDPANRGNLTGGDGQFAAADSDYCGNGTTMDTTLTSPVMDVSTLANVNLSYNYEYHNLVPAESADLDVSADGGATWINVHHWNTPMRGPATFTQDVTALLGGSTQAMLRFHYIAPGWDWWWQVDNAFAGEKICHPVGGGGLVVGRVADAIDNHALVGATVTSDTGAATTAKAVGDPAMGNFYALFQPAGDHTLTATMPKYSPSAAVVSAPTGMAVRQDFALQSGHLTYTPASVSQTIPAGGSVTTQVTVENTGGGAATFEIIELDKGSVAFGTVVEDFTHSAASIARAPQVSGKPVDNLPSPLAGVPAVAMDIYPGGDLVSFDTATPGDLTIIGSLGGNDYYAGDFVAGDFSKLYAIDSTTGELVTFDTADAARTVIGEPAISGGQSWTGISYDQVTAQLYAVSTDCAGAATLYTIDPTTGISTALTALSGVTCPIDIAASPTGELYAVDIAPDTLVKIDAATGAATTIGSIGFDANYAQSMDFDDVSGVFYFAAYDNGSAAGQLRIIDPTTGATTLVGNFEGNAEIDGLAIQTGGGGGGVDVPWLSAAPTQVTLGPGESVTIDVTLDAASVAPGVYSAELKFVHDTPSAVPNLPVKMTASIPPGMGKLMGTVLTTGYCDQEQTPLADVPVTINSAAFSQPLALDTAADGSYYVWLDQAASPLTVEVNAGADYASGSATGVVLAGMQTTVQDFTLRLLKPCLNATPPSLMATLPLGASTTRPLTLRNLGGGEATFVFENKSTGFTPPAAQTTAANTVTIGDLPFSKNPSPPKQSSDPFANYAHKVNNGSTTITQSNSQTITAGNSVSCNNGAHADNHYLRVFDLAAFGISGDFAITNVSFGIEESSPGGATQPVEVRLYTLNGAFTFANLTPIGSAAVDVSSQSLTILDVPVTGTAPDGAKLVVDIFTPNGQASGHSFFIGSNSLGETGPSYLAAADCGAPEPVTIASLGFPEMMIVMNVTGITGGGGPATWLSEAPSEGTLASDAQQPVVVTFNAGKVNKPGTYKASASVLSNDPMNQSVDVQTTMVVTAPANWGVLKGTISSLGYCDAAPAPLADSTVTVTNANGLVRTAVTAANGGYEIWLPDYGSPYTVLAAADGYLDASASGIVVNGLGTTTQDLSQRWLQPCLSATPSQLSATLDWQQSTVVELTLANRGAGASTFEISEIPGQFTPLGMTGSQILIVNGGGYNTDAANAFKTALDNLSYTSDVVISSSSTGIPATLTSYMAVLYAGQPNPGVEHDQLVAYLDAGGRLLIADNDWGYSNRNTITPLYGEYFQAAYVADSGSDGPITGVDIMAGTDTDISSDPYPDSFTIGPDSVGIFANTAPLLDWAGMRIARQAYRGVYLAWDFHQAGGGAVGDAVETEIMDKLVPWLTAADVDWLAAAPNQGTLPADEGLQQVNVTLDSAAASVMQPGTYTAQLRVKTQDPENDVFQVMVSMTVNPDAAHGKLWGTVNGLGACDLNPAPLEGAVVQIQAGAETIQVETDAQGHYQYWLTASDPTLDLSVTADGHLGETRTVAFAPGEDPQNQADFDLRWQRPCGALTPDSLSAEVLMGESVELPAMIENTGWAPLNFNFHAAPTGFIPMGATTAGEDVLLVAANTDSADALAASLERLGTTYLQVTPSTLPPVETWTDYAAVIWAGSPSSDENAGLMTSYLDAGGSLLITYNDLGYSYGAHPLYADYLEAAYALDYGSQGTITGAGIMAGLNIDVSADPYPDSFTITGPNAAAIFTNDAPNSDLAGLSIAKDDYKAVYFAWNFNYTGATDSEKDDVLGKALEWLTPGATWIQAAPPSGTVAEQAEQAVTVTLDAGDPQITQPGAYQGVLKMGNNTPGHETISIPVTLQVNPPASWGKLQGTVQGLGYCDGSPAPLADALVTLTAGGATAELKTDANGYYSYWFDAAAGPVNVSIDAAEHAAGSASAPITAGGATTQDFSLRWLKPCSSVDPASFDVVIPAGGALDQSLTLINAGAAATEWTISAVGVANVAQPSNKIPFAGKMFNGAQPEVRKAAAGPSAVQAAPPDLTGEIDLALDDGAAEDSIGVNDSYAAYQFIWLNRFTPDSSAFPFNLEQISILWPSAQVAAGSAVELVVYQDTDGDGDPSNAELMGSYNVNIQNVDGATWDVYTLPAPLVLGGPGDILIGAIDRWVNSGSTAVHYPANVDTTSSQGRSWVGYWLFDPPTPPALPPNDTFATIDSLGLPGNWMIRASGSSGAAVTWLTVEPETDSLAADSQQNVNVHFDAAAEGVATGVYEATLRYRTDDPLHPTITIPVSMTVGQLVTLTKTVQETAFVGAGEILHYTLTAVNAGNRPLTNVSISDPKLGALTCAQPATLQPGESLICTGTYTTKAADVKANFTGVVTNTATVTATSGARLVSAAATASVPQTSTRFQAVSMNCAQFAASGASAGLTKVDYTARRDRITGVTPNTLVFWEKFTAPVAGFPLVISQSNTGGWLPMAVANGSSATLFNANCSGTSARVKTSYNTATGALTLNITNAAPGATYFVAVRYNPASLLGIPVSTPAPTVTYTFATSANGVALPAGVARLKFVPK